MATILTKDTLINGTLYKRGAKIDGIATKGEIESLLYMGRARTSEAKPAPVDDPEPEPELEAEPVDEPEPEPVLVDVEDEDEEALEEILAEESEIKEFDELETAIDAAGLPSNVFDALYEADIRSVDALKAKLAEPGYKLSTVKGIGSKTEERIREAFHV